jgi:hypothetical protein
MMVRRHVYLTARERTLLRQIAKKEKISMSALIRRGVTTLINRRRSTTRKKA